MEHIILASTSPRRQEYFRMLGLPFSCVPSPVEEVFTQGDAPRSAAEKLALIKTEKALEILRNDPPLWVCGADTLISLNGEIFGKPGNRDAARAMLRVLSGRTHEVITALALYNGRTRTTDCKSVASSVTFAPLVDEEIEWYLEAGEWRDAAGAYKIQGLASCFISGIEGSYSSIVGLPLREFYIMLRNNNYHFGG